MYLNCFRNTSDPHLCYTVPCVQMLIKCCFGANILGTEDPWPPTSVTQKYAKSLFCTMPHLPNP